MLANMASDRLGDRMKEDRAVSECAICFFVAFFRRASTLALGDVGRAERILLEGMAT